MSSIPAKLQTLPPSTIPQQRDCSGRKCAQMWNQPKNLNSVSAKVSKNMPSSAPARSGIYYLKFVNPLKLIVGKRHFFPLQVEGIQYNEVEIFVNNCDIQGVRWVVAGEK